MKKEKEEDVRNGPVVVYVANGKRSIVPKLEPSYAQVTVAVEMPAVMERVLTKLDRANDRRRQQLQAEIAKAAFGL
jgi:ribose 1,5-bisphosphokinase PhnN